MRENVTIILLDLILKLKAPLRWRRFHTREDIANAVRREISRLDNGQWIRSVGDEPRTGRPTIFAENVEAIQNAIEHSPHVSTHHLSRELGIPPSSVRKVLRFTLKKLAYHLQVVYKLEAEDYAARQAMCFDLCEAVNRHNLMNHIIFTDEATFHQK
ncbi:hypothetical protein C0J52_10539 [Blattella germanica]|nr:hypothetical protein C0J52_10539 [Blattella germanica]